MINMKRFKSVLLIILFIFVFSALSTITYGWLSDNGMSNKLSIKASMLKSYFESGDGTSEAKYDSDGNIVQSNTGPYEIKYPVQLYYLAWLQELGYFNIDTDGDGIVNTTYFYLSSDIDMKDYILPPIGTKSNPFVGNFDGQGHVISNLKIENDNNSLTDSPRNELINVEIIGFFGVVGTTSEDGKVVNTDAKGNATYYNYDSSVNVIKDFFLENVNVSTVTSQSLIGIAAGFVNGSLSGVGIIDSSIESSGATNLTFTNNVSDYSLVGYCTDEFKDDLKVTRIKISQPTTTNSTYVVDDAGGGWGGSVDMKSMFTRLQSIIKSLSRSTYTYEKTIWVDSDGNYLKEESTLTNNYGKIYQDEDAGSFLFTAYSDNDWSEQYTYLSGGVRTNKKIYSLTKYKSMLIKKDNNYLSLSNNIISNVTSEDNATLWTYSSVTDNSGQIFTIINDSDLNASYYYLVNKNGILDISTSKNVNSTSWYYDESLELYYCIYQESRLYIEYIDGNWQFSGFNISDGDNNYLSVNSSKQIINTNVMNDASQLYFLDNALYTYINNVKYYLINNNGSLSLSTTNNVTWSRNYNNFLCEYNNVKYYIELKNDNWILSITSTFMISSNDNYLSINNNNVTNTNDLSSAANWYFENDMYLCTNINGKKYLNCQNGVLSLDNSYSTEWYTDDIGIYYIDNDLKLYISYDNSWKALFKGVYIKNSDGHYLNITNNSISSSIDYTNATMWQFVENSGMIVTYDNDNDSYEYLTNNNGQLSISSTFNNVKWILDENNSFYSVYNNYNYYLIYDDGWILSNGFFISVNDNYLNYNNSEFSNTGDKTIWYFETNRNNTYLYTLINNTKNYISNANNRPGGNNSNSLTVSTNTNNALTFNTSNNTLSYTNGRRETYLYYSNGWTLGNSQTSLTITYLQDYFSFEYIENITLIYNSADLIIDSYPKDIDFIESNDSLKEYEYLDNEFSVDNSVDNVTYFPLIANESGDFKVLSNNTGYVISSSYDDTTGGTFPLRSGDIRVSYYSVSGYINSTTQQSPKSYSFKTNGFVNVTTDNYETYGLQKFADSFSSFTDLISDTNVYGLHFMNAQISKDSLVTAKKVVINGDTYYNYEMPTNCIDFQLKERGFINFYAGTYFLNNNSFFSLHQIFRDENKKITDIKEIKYVYGVVNNGQINTKEEYIYVFTDGTYSGNYNSIPENYTLIFNTDWITSPEGVGDKDNNAYYFEVPVNAGEFALGSAEGKIGAYLLYLDLSANKQEVERTTVTEVIEKSTLYFEFPKGVSLLENTSEIVDEKKSTSIMLESGFTGINEIKKIENNVNYTAGTSGYIGEGLSANGEHIGAYTKVDVELIEIVTNYDFNTTTKNESIIVTTTTVITLYEQESERSIYKSVDGIEDSTVVDDNHEIKFDTSIIDLITWNDEIDITFTSSFDVDLNHYKIYISSSESVDIYAIINNSNFSATLNDEELSTTESVISSKVD